MADFRLSAALGEVHVQHLRVRHPIVFVDNETPGLDLCRDRIVEVALLRFAGRQVAVPVGALQLWRELPPAAAAVDRTPDEHVLHCPPFGDAAPKLTGFVGDAELAGIGESFDSAVYESDKDVPRQIPHGRLRQGIIGRPGFAI